MTRLRIATFSYGLPVPGVKRGGIERAAHTLADGLARRGHEVVVFPHGVKPAAAAYEVRALPCRTFVDTWLGRRMMMEYVCREWSREKAFRDPASALRGASDFDGTRGRR